jgi:GDP-L-fucose synthase
MKTNNRIYVSGHKGMVGSAISRKLSELGYHNLIFRTKNELDLLDQQKVNAFFAEEKPEYVFVAAAKVGGIVANNTYRAQFLYENLQIQNNIIHCAYLTKVKKLLFLGSSCIYPKFANQPIKEEYLLTGELERTNEPYAIAKIAGIRMCQEYNAQYNTNFISAMPTNLYGPYDNFDLETSHVLPALIRKFDEAKRKWKSSVTIWGSGSPKREFLHVDDLASACIYLMKKYNDSDFLNIGTGKDISIGDLAALISEIVQYEGQIVYDRSKPDGTPRKLLDISRIKKLGWEPEIDLRKGIEMTYQWYKDKSEI